MPLFNACHFLKEKLKLGTQITSNSSNDRSTQLKTIHENERDHIIAVLKKCNGRIWGVGGAAEVLNLPPTTLTSKMKKPGILKDEF